MFIKLINALLLVHLCTAKYWEGNWFPADPGAVDTNDNVDTRLLHDNNEKTYDSTGNKVEIDLKDDVHGIKMGVTNPDCDDAKKNLNVDWDGSPEAYTCFQKRFKVNRSIQPKKICHHIPKGYNARHYCMNKTILYDEEIPTFGNHRPLWAKYGEYKYLPKQRWLHNLEHGAIVMLYHPCTKSKEVKKLKTILKNCMWKHVISADNGLTREWPMTLLSWGCKYILNAVNEEEVIDFIKTHANHGPEKMYNQGFYTKELKHSAKIISNQNDTIVCPPMPSRL